MDRYVELVQQYPGQQQVDLAVEILFPVFFPFFSLLFTVRQVQCSGSRVLRGARISRRYQGGAQDQGECHPLHLPRGRIRRAEFGRLLDETIAVEPLTQ